MLTKLETTAIIVVLTLSGLFACADDEQLSEFKGKTSVESTTRLDAADLTQSSAQGEAVHPEEAARYLTVFGYQSKRAIFSIRDPRLSHTFASVVIDQDPSRADDPLTVQTISWAPQDGSICLGDCTPKAGINLTLRQTIRRYSKHEDAELKILGPVEITREIADQLLAQKARLDSRHFTYLAVDRPFRRAAFALTRGSPLNCIHALSNVVKYVETGDAHGWTATEKVFALFRPFAVNPRVAHQEILRQVRALEFPAATN